VKPEDVFQERLLQALNAFVVTRAQAKPHRRVPVVPGLGARHFHRCSGLLAAGLLEEVKQILLTFARFEQNGTLPNTILERTPRTGTLRTRRLWFGVVWRDLQADLDQLRPLRAGRCIRCWRALPPTTSRAAPMASA